MKLEPGASLLAHDGCQMTTEKSCLCVEKPSPREKLYWFFCFCDQWSQLQRFCSWALRAVDLYPKLSRNHLSTKVEQMLSSIPPLFTGRGLQVSGIVRTLLSLACFHSIVSWLDLKNRTDSLLSVILGVEIKSTNLFISYLMHITCLQRTVLKFLSHIDATFIWQIFVRDSIRIRATQGNEKVSEILM